MEPKDLLERITSSSGKGMTLEDVYSQVGPGWKGIVTDLVNDLFELGWDGQLNQIKEKFGGLRFYTGVLSDEAYARVDQAEIESMRTCEQCGAKGRPDGWGSGWIRTLCKTHGAEERVKNESP